MGHVCPVLHAPDDPKPFVQGSHVNVKAHYIGWLVCGIMSTIATGVSFWLIWKHLTYYTCPQQQRHIVRMLFMVPIYAVVSTLSYIFFKEAIYYQTIRDCYEAVVITSFFYLLVQYIGDTPAEQHEVFRTVKLKKWFWPLGFWKWRPSSGLSFLWLMKVCILQYAIVRPVCTLTAVVLQYFGLYCLESWAPYFGHIYLTLAISVSVTVAMYCLVQLYIPIQDELKPYHPILKFLAVKSCVFLTFWQDSFLSILVFFNVIKPTQFMTAENIQVGYDALLETTEMVIFSLLHIKAFTYVVYRPSDQTRVTCRWRAFLDVLDYRDWYYQMKQTSRYIAAKSRGRDFTIVEDIRRERYEHLEKALGRDRWSLLRLQEKQGKEEMPSFWAPGCEPRDEQSEDTNHEGLKEQDMAELHLHSEDSAMSLVARKQPRLLASMHPDYDPEAEDNRPLDDYIPGSDEARQLEKEHMLPPAKTKKAVSSSAITRNRTQETPPPKPPNRRVQVYRDDPEMDKPNRAGLVTAGPRSFLQAKLRNLATKAKPSADRDEPNLQRTMQQGPREPVLYEVAEDSSEPADYYFASPESARQPERPQQHQASAIHDVRTVENTQNTDRAASRGPESRFAADQRRSMPPLSFLAKDPTDLNMLVPQELPAPSQLLHCSDADPFSAARPEAVNSVFGSATRAGTYDHTPLQSRRPVSFQIGSIISRRELELATTAPPLSPDMAQNSIARARVLRSPPNSAYDATRRMRPASMPPPRADDTSQTNHPRHAGRTQRSDIAGQQRPHETREGYDLEYLD